MKSRIPKYNMLDTAVFLQSVSRKIFCTLIKEAARKGSLLFCLHTGRFSRTGTLPARHTACFYFSFSSRISTLISSLELTGFTSDAFIPASKHLLPILSYASPERAMIGTDAA